MPDTVSDGDIYVYGDYFYQYVSSDGGWTAGLAIAETGILNYIPSYPITDKNQQEYGTILQTINNTPVVKLYYTFQDCEELTTAPKIPSSVTGLYGAFMGCASMNSVVIPNGVSIIGAEAFLGCLGLVSIEIPSSITNIGSAAFTSCHNLQRISFEGTVGQWHRINFADGWNFACGQITVTCSDGTITVPAHSS